MSTVSILEDVLSESSYIPDTEFVIPHRPIEKGMEEERQGACQNDQPHVSEVREDSAVAGDIVEDSYKEIENIVSILENDPVLKNMNVKKLDAAYDIGYAIKRIHENLKGREEKSKANARIRKILGREKQTIQYYKQLTYFEKDLSLADLGIGSVARLSGNLSNYAEIVQQDIKTIRGALLTIDNKRCQDEESLRAFQSEIANTKPSAFCKNVILHEAKKHFNEDYSHILESEDGLTLSVSKRLFDIIKDEAKYEFEESLRHIEKKKKNEVSLSLKEFMIKFTTIEKKMDSLFNSCAHDELVQCFEKFQNKIHEIYERNKV